MPNGCFGTAKPLANTKTTIFTVPAGKVSTVNINVANAADIPASVNLYIGPSPAQGAEWDARYCVEPGTLVQGRGVLHRTGFAMSAGESLAVVTDGTSISVRADGFEEEA
jgi:hypothetical protein